MLPANALKKHIGVLELRWTVPKGMQAGKLGAEASLASEQGRAPWMHRTLLPSDHTSTLQCRELASSSASAGSTLTPSWCTCG